MATPGFFNPYSGQPYNFGALSSSGGFSLLGNASTAGPQAAFTPTSSFITNIKNPTLSTAGGALLATVPGILEGNYPKAVAQGVASYGGSAAGSAAAVGLGLSGGPVTAAALLGGLAASTLAGNFFRTQPQRHSAGANLQVEGGLASFQSSGQDKYTTTFVDEFINYVAQGANEVLSSYGLKLPDTPDRMVGGPGDPYGGSRRLIGNQYRLAVEDLGKDGQERSLAVVGPTGEKRSFTGANQAQQAYEYAVTSLLESVPGFTETVNRTVTTGADIITPGTGSTAADVERPIVFPKELQYDPASVAARGGPTILSLGAAPAELKPAAQQAYYRQRRESAVNQRRSRGIRTSPRGVTGRASVTKSVISGA